MASMNTHPDAFATILRLSKGLQSSRYTSAAATAIYLYNIPLTLDIEVEHIWSRLSFDLPTILYIVNRYICLGFFLVATFTIAGFHADFNDAYCRMPIDLLGIGLAHTSWTGIMTLRVCALWRQKKAIVWMVLILWVVVVGIVGLFLYLAYMEVGVSVVYNYRARICTPTVTPHILNAVSIAPLVCELILTILTVIKVFDFAVRPSGTNVPFLYRVIARDGVAYFVIGTSLTTINTVLLFVLEGQTLLLVFALYLAIMSTLMARLVLNLRVVHQKTVLDQLGSSGGTSNTYDFSSQSEFRGRLSRIVLGEADTGVGTRDLVHDSSRVEPDEEAAWHVTDMQAAPPIPLNIVNTSRRKSMGYAETLPEDIGQARRRGQNGVNGDYSNNTVNSQV